MSWRCLQTSINCSFWLETSKNMDTFIDAIFVSKKQLWCPVCFSSSASLSKERVHTKWNFNNKVSCTLSPSLRHGKRSFRNTLWPAYIQASSTSRVQKIKERVSCNAHLFCGHGWILSRTKRLLDGVVQVLPPILIAWDVNYTSFSSIKMTSSRILPLEILYGRWWPLHLVIIPRRWYRRRSMRRSRILVHWITELLSAGEKHESQLARSLLC